MLGGGPSPAARLRTALDRLGPAFSFFGDYLALRADLLPLADSIELGRGPPAAPVPIEAVENLLREEWGSDSAELGGILGPAERSSRLYQWHPFVLKDGEKYFLKILRPDLRKAADHASCFGALETARVLLEDGSRLDMEAAVADFNTFLRRSLDLRGQAESLAECATAGREFDSFRAAVPVCRLSTPNVLCTEAFDPEESPVRATLRELIEGGADDTDLARRLALAWLEAALLGPAFFEGPFLDDAVVTEDGRLGIAGGLTGRIDRSLQVELIRYLTATADDDPDRAGSIFLDITRAGPGAEAPRELRLRFRQAEPFRTGGWSRYYQGRRLADTLFIQWRIARQGGYSAPPELEAFMRGLYAVETCGRVLAPGRDGLREGLADLRVVAAAVRLREFFGPTRFTESIETVLETGRVLFDRLQEAARDDGTPEDARNGRRGESGGVRENRTTVFLGLLLLVGAVVLVLDRAGGNPASGSAAGRVGAVLFAVLAFLLLWYAGRDGGR